MLEWLKRHAWKACIRQKRIPSSNLGHSAKIHIFKIPQAVECLRDFLIKLQSHHGKTHFYSYLCF